MIIRKAVYDDINAVKSIYEDARAFMRQSGNMKQWSGGYPAEADIISGLKKKLYFFVILNGE